MRDLYVMQFMGHVVDLPVVRNNLEYEPVVHCTEKNTNLTCKVFFGNKNTRYVRLFVL